MLLLSTRVGGLIGTGASTEVKLTLMSIPESVQLLAHGAGLDSDILSPSLLEVARLCGKCICVCAHLYNFCSQFTGRLPLTLNIVARLISDSGDDWEEE
jgi:hypothetical protein